MNTLFWGNNGSLTSVPALEHLMHLQDIHQSQEFCIPHNDYVPGSQNHISDVPLHSYHLTYTALIHHFENT